MDIAALALMFVAGVFTDEAIRWILRAMDDRDLHDWPMDDKGAP